MVLSAISCWNMRRKRDLINNPDFWETDELIIKHARWLEAQVHNQYLLPQINDPTKKLGCGHFGCVYQTYVKGIVCKVTYDSPRTIDHLTQLMKLQPIPGLAVVYQVSKLPHLWWHFIWREEVEPPDYNEAYDVATLYYNVVFAIREMSSHNHAFARRPFMSVCQEVRDELIKLEDVAPTLAAMLCRLLKENLIVTDVSARNMGHDADGQWIVFDPLFESVRNDAGPSILENLENLPFIP